MTQFVWIDVVGLPLQIIEAEVLGGRIMVDEDTLGTMESSILEAQLTDEQSTQEYAATLRDLPRDQFTGFFDVTDIGGGWEMWQDMKLDDES